MYIGRVQVNKNWTKLDTLIQNQVSGQSSFSFNEAKTYQLQCEGNYGVRLCNTTAAPSDLEAGERIIGTQTALFKKESDADLYVRPIEDLPANIVFLKVSIVGED